ncbi:MAG: hypothetical protein P8182_20395 [Deltaproteobacteria bacterium]
MEAGDIIHLKGIKAEYRLFGKTSFLGCIMPDGDYVILSFEQHHINLAWRTAEGQPSKKHQYRVEDFLIPELVTRTSNRESLPQS